jgi:hypothetical protein
MKRLIAFLLAFASLFAATIGPTNAQEGIAEATRADVAAIKAAVERIELKLAAGSIPPTGTPIVDPVKPPPPATVTVTSAPVCYNDAPHVIWGQGTRRNVCTCSPAVVQVRHATPGAKLIVTKMTGAGNPSVPPGMVTIREGGQVVGTCGSTCNFDIGLGDRDFVFTSEVPCTNLSVQVR